MTTPLSLPLSRGERKTCLECAKAKRTCNKQMPSCQRCSLKSLDCQYPTSRRYSRAPSKLAQRDRPGTGGLSSPIPGNLDIAAESRADSPMPYKVWFLELDTWVIDGVVGTNTCRFNPDSMRVCSGAKAWATSLGDWLHQWVEEGRNPFIHQQLYADLGLPQCLQDAWTTVTAYFSKTPLNENILLKIIEDRADRLLQAEAADENAFFMVEPGSQTIHHLARVQALFIYQFIRLYDGSIRQRALAETCFRALLPWCQQLWQSATLDACHKVQLGLDPADGPAATSLWRAWVLAESVRRTWLVCHSTMATYFRERDGWNECTGEIRFTASEGLWDAPSAIAWTRLAGQRDPIFVKSLHVDELLSIAGPGEVDTFCTVFMTLLLGKEKVDSWASNTPRIARTFTPLGLTS